MITFNVFDNIRYCGASESCFRVDVMYSLVTKVLNLPKEELDTCPVKSGFSIVKDLEMEVFALWMSSFGSNNRKYFK